jgi:hypothetical protein
VPAHRPTAGSSQQGPQLRGEAVFHGTTAV